MRNLLSRLRDTPLLRDAVLRFTQALPLPLTIALNRSTSLGGKRSRQINERHKRRLSLGCLSLLLSAPFANAQSISFLDAWQKVQQDNQSLSAERYNQQRYRCLSRARQALNWPSLSLENKYTLLDRSVELSAKDMLDSSNVNLPTSGALAPITPIINHALEDLSFTLSDRRLFNASLQMVWPIFTGGKISAAQEAAEGKVDEADSQFALLTRDKYEQLSTYYFSTLLAKEVLATRQKVSAGLKLHLSHAFKLEQNGQIAKVERLQAEAAYDKAKVDEKKAADDLAIAQLALNTIVNASSPIQPEGKLFVNHALPPVTAFIEQTLASYPGLDLLNAKAVQARSLLKADQGKYSPDIYLYGNYKLSDNDTLAEKLSPNWLIGVGVSVPLLDTSGRSEQIQSAESLLNQIEALKNQAKQDLTLLVTKTYLEARQARDQVEGLHSALALATANLDLREKSFNQGLSSSIEVVDAQMYLASIQTQVSLAKFSYLMSLTKLLALADQMTTFPLYALTPTKSTPSVGQPALSLAHHEPAPSQARELNRPLVPHLAPIKTIR